MGRLVRFRNNRIPYMFPAWVNGEFQHLTLMMVLEMSGSIVKEDETFVTIDVDPADLDTVGNPELKTLRIEWVRECLEVLEP